jgi:hypothetical protein
MTKKPPTSAAEAETHLANLTTRKLHPPLPIQKNPQKIVLLHLTHTFSTSKSAISLYLLYHEEERGECGSCSINHCPLYRKIRQRGVRVVMGSVHGGRNGEGVVMKMWRRRFISGDGIRYRIKG